MSFNLKTALNASYETDNNKQPEFNGYILDKQLSTNNSKTFYNPTEKKQIITFRGTTTAADVGTDLYLGAGLLRHTDRYKESKQHYDASKAKYADYDTTILGHSLGGGLASAVGKKEDKIISYNKGATIFGSSTKNKSNEAHYKQKGDLVSKLAPTTKNTFDNRSLLEKYFVSDYSILGVLNNHKINKVNKNIFI